MKDAENMRLVVYRIEIPLLRTKDRTKTDASFFFSLHIISIILHMIKYIDINIAIAYQI